MNPTITQTFGQYFGIDNGLFFIIVFALFYLVVNIIGLKIQGRMAGAIFSGMAAILAVTWGVIPLWEALIFLFISLIEFGSWFIRKTPTEKPTDEAKLAENNKPPEITGAFDKSQFNKRS